MEIGRDFGRWTRDDEGRKSFQKTGPFGGEAMGGVVAEIFEKAFLPDEAVFLAGGATVVVTFERGVQFAESAAVGVGVLGENDVADEDGRKMTRVPAQELFDGRTGGSFVDDGGFDGVAGQNWTRALNAVAIGEPEKVAKMVEARSVERRGVSDQNARGGAGDGFLEQKPGHEGKSVARERIAMRRY